MPHDEGRPPEGTPQATAARDPSIQPRPRRGGSPSDGSSVALWRSSKGQPKWSIRVVGGTTEAELDELVRLALRAERQLTDGPQP